MLDSREQNVVVVRLLVDSNSYVCFRATAASRLMGNLVVTNKKAQFVLTHKLLLQQYLHPVSGNRKDEMSLTAEHIINKQECFFQILQPLLKSNTLVFGHHHNSNLILCKYYGI